MVQMIMELACNRSVTLTIVDEKQSRLQKQSRRKAKQALKKWCSSGIGTGLSPFQCLHLRFAAHNLQEEICIAYADEVALIHTAEDW